MVTLGYVDQCLTTHQAKDSRNWLVLGHYPRER